MVDIFFGHSSEDKDLIELVKSALSEVGVQGIFAEFEIAGRPLPEKLRNDIRQSRAVVFLWTRNVSETQSTRDIVNAEAGEAHMAGKPVYMFREDRTEVPMFLKYITDYYTFTSSSVKDAITRLKEFCKQYKQDEDYWNSVGLVVLSVAAIGAVLGAIFFALSGVKSQK